MVIISILPKTHSRLTSLAQSKNESINSIINRLIDDHETLENWDGDPYESPLASEYRAQREKTHRMIESGVNRINKRYAKTRENKRAK